jgi:hypothetical protein
MTIIQKLRARTVIHRVAKQQGISTAQCRADMAAAITEAWRTADPQTKNRQIQLVGDSHIPSPEEIILLISQKVLDR